MSWAARARLLAQAMCGAVLPLLAASAALARPGGGHTFSGPSGHDFSGPSGHGGGGEALELVVLLVRLGFFYPKLALPVLIVVIVLWVRLSRSGQLENWTAHAEHAAHTPRPRATPAARDAFAGLRALDPDFSRVLLEDFAYRLFASVQRARCDAQALGALAPYLADDVRAALLRPDLQSIDNVVVGALRVLNVALPAAADDPEAQVQIELGYEANLTLSAAGRAETLYVREAWTLGRARDARSKPPGGYERLGCPNCGAPFRASDDRRCAYCGQVVGDGRFNWSLSTRRVLEEERHPPSLSAQVSERGTDLPTRYAPDHEARWQELTARDPALSEAALAARIGLIHAELNRAWSARELASVRALVSDGMFDYLQYWVQAYKAQNLQNVLENTRISRLSRVKVTSDRYFDALTVRLFASGIDCTRELGSGRLVSGDAQQPRSYSEYWTLIRGAGVRGAPRSDASCPNCAAPLSASMAGDCAHCGAHLTSGEFDWVLSKIEQDDVYDG